MVSSRKCLHSNYAVYRIQWYRTFSRNGNVNIKCRWSIKIVVNILFTNKKIIFFNFNFKLEFLINYTSYDITY